MHSLAIVGHREELWHLGTTPNCHHFLSDGRLRLTTLATRLLVLRNHLVLELTRDAHQNSLQVASFEAIRSNCDQVHSVLFQQLCKLLLILLMLLLFISLGQGAAVVWLITVLVSALPRGQQSHEISRLHKLTILIHDSHCDDVVVGIDLVHDDAHDIVALTILHNLIVLLVARLPRVLLLVLVVLRSSLRGEWTSHEESTVDFFGLGDHVVFSLFLDLFSDFLDEFSDENLVDEGLDNLGPQNVPLISLAFGVLHVQSHEEVLEIGLLCWVDGNIDRDEASFLALENVQVEVVLIPQSRQREPIHALDSVTWMEEIEIFPALLRQLRRDIAMLANILLHLVADQGLG